MAEILAVPIQKEVKQPRRYTLEEYFKREEKAIHKHEYHNGIIVTMPGGKLPHNRIATKASKLMDNFVEDNELNYIVSNSDTKIRIEEYDKVVYPDAVVICEIPEYFEDREDTVVNPLIIVEVLSRSTQNYDKTLKFEMYRSIPTFKEYVLIHQDKKKVSVYTKQIDNSWILKDYEGEEAVATLYALHNCPLPLNRLYKGLVLKNEK
jgi:Uma2 family endonuclease